jgi:hypothetical protein
MIDHCILIYLFYQPSLNARRGRWMELISEFDFEIKHIKGKDNKLENTLSWSVHTIHLAKKSVKESNIKNIIRTLLQKDDIFN